MGARFEGQDFLNGLGFGIRGGEQVLGGEFVLAHVLFNAEGSDLHEGECAKGRGGASRTKLSGGRAGHPVVGHLSEYATNRASEICGKERKSPTVGTLLLLELLV